MPRAVVSGEPLRDELESLSSERWREWSVKRGGGARFFFWARIEDDTVELGEVLLWKGTAGEVDRPFEARSA